MGKLILYSSLLISIVGICWLVGLRSAYEDHNRAMYNNPDQLIIDGCLDSKIITLAKWKRFSDSMVSIGYEKFTIKKIFKSINFASKCAKYKNIKKTHQFIIEYKRSKPTTLISEDSIIKLRIAGKFLNAISNDSILKFRKSVMIELFTNYFTDQTIVNNESFEFKDELGNPLGIRSREVLKLCNFKIVKVGKNKYKRIFSK